MSALHEMIKGKKVVFVGPATYMEGKGRGKQIDSQDVVIRTNDSFPLLKNREQDYGSRCDILAMNCYFMASKRYLTPEQYKDLGIHLLLLKTGSGPEIEKVNKDIKAMRIQYYPKDPLLKVTYTGALIMEMIIRCKPASFWLTGMDFYLGDPSSWWYPEYNVL